MSLSYATVRRTLSAALFAVLAVVAAPAARAANGTWIQNQGGTYNWGDTANWASGTVATGTDALGTFTPFGITSPGITVNLETSYTVGNLFIDNPSNAFPWTFSTNAGATLTLATTSGTPTITVGNNLTANFSVALAGSQGFTKAGAGTISLSGANVYSGNTNVNGGLLQLDFTGATTTDILPNATTLVLGNGGSLTVLGTGAGFSQTVAGLTLNAGAATINANISGGSISTINLNTITRNNGGQVTFVAPTTGNSFNTATANGTGNILGGYAVFQNSTNGATGFAANNGSGLIIPLGTYLPAGTTANFVAGNNIDETSTNATVSPAASVTFNSLRFNSSAGSSDTILSLSGVNTIQSGGILVTTSVGGGFQPDIVGGSITSGTTDIVVTQLNFYRPLNITSQITGAIGLTTAGIGTTILGGSNNYTGPTVVGGGTLLANTTSALPGYNAAGLVTVYGGGTLSVSTSDAGPWLPADITTLRANASFQPGSALGFDVSVGNSLTYSPVISGALGVTKNNDGTLVLTGTNTFTGLTTINGGVLSAGSIANAGVASAIGAGTDLTFSLGGTFQYTGASVAVDRGILLSFNGGNVNVSTAATNLSLSGLVYGVGGLTKSGPGTLTITGTGVYAGPTLVTGGTLVFSGANSIPAGNNLTIFAGATVSIGAGATPTLAGLSGGGTLNLGAATQLNLGSDTGSGSFQGTITGTNNATLAVVKNGSGIQALIGGNTYGGGTVLNAGTLLLSPQTAGANPLGTGVVSIPTTGVTLAYRQLLPVPTTGYNRDVIYGVGEGSNAPLRGIADLKATIGFDTFNNLIYYSQGVPGPSNAGTGLPKNLALPSLVGGGSTFIMQPYNANNCVFMGGGATATLGIGSPGSFKSINLLGASTNGATTFTATLNFQDGTSTVFTGLSFADWFNGTTGLAAGGGGTTTVPGAITAGLDRYNFLSNGFDNNTSNPRLYQVGITLSTADSAKVLTSVTMTSQAATATAFGVFALNGTTSGAPATISPGNAVNITAAGTTNLEVSGYTAVNFGALTLNGTAGANTIALTGTSGSFLNFTGTTFVAAVPTLNVPTGVTMNLGVLTDGNAGIGLIKQGAGTLVLASGTSYAGGTGAGSVQIQAGTLIAQAPSALPGYTTAGAVTLSTGAALVAGYGGAGQFTAANITTLQGNVTFVSGSQFGLDVSTGSQTYSNVLSLPAGVGFVKTGNGILAVGNANTYAGVTTISGGELSAATLGLAGFNSSLGSSSAAAANLVFNNGALLQYTGGTNTTNRSFTLNAGTGTASGGGFDIPSGTVLTETGASTGGGILYKSGAGTLLLTGANGSTGGLTIGTITFVGGVPVIGTGGGTVQIGAGGTAGSYTSSTTAPIIDNGTLTFFRSDTISQANPISGTGNIVKLGAGSLTLSGTNSYTGTTTVTTGILQAGSTSAFGTNSAVSVASGATLTLNGNSNTIGSLAGAGLVTNNSTTNITLTLGGDNTSTTYSGVIQNGGTGTLTLVKNGTGTLTLTGASTYSGGVTLNNGTISVSTDAALGTGSFTNTAFGTLNFSASTTTAKSFNLGTGNLAISAGATLTVNGGQIGGGYIGGSGSLATNATNGAIFSGITTQPSTTLASNSSNDRYFNFSNGGALTMAANLAAPIVASGFTNQGSGGVTVGANTTFNVENFQSYGTVTLNPGTGGSLTTSTILRNTGTAPVYFNGGSRTFIATPATAANFTAGLDLNGKNAIVAGGLFVNNGFVIDTGAAGSAVVIADYGATVKGAGFFQNPVQTRNGGIFSVGNSPGQGSSGSVVFGTGGTTNYQFQINNSQGVAGPTGDANNQVSGWSLLKAVSLTFPVATTGNFSFTATSATKMNVMMFTMLNPATVGDSTQGPMSNFNPANAYSFAAVTYQGAYVGPTDDATLTGATTFDTSSFSYKNATTGQTATALNGGSFGWHLDQTSKTLFLTFTPAAVPEPLTVGLVAAGALGLGGLRRRLRNRKAATAV